MILCAGQLVYTFIAIGVLASTIIVLGILIIILYRKLKERGNQLANLNLIRNSTMPMDDLSHAKGRNNSQSANASSKNSNWDVEQHRVINVENYGWTPSSGKHGGITQAQQKPAANKARKHSATRSRATCVSHASKNNSTSLLNVSMGSRSSQSGDDTSSVTSASSMRAPVLTLTLPEDEPSGVTMSRSEPLVTKPAAKVSRRHSTREQEVASEMAKAAVKSGIHVKRTKRRNAAEAAAIARGDISPRRPPRPKSTTRSAQSNETAKAQASDVVFVDWSSPSNPKPKKRIEKKEEDDIVYTPVIFFPSPSLEKLDKPRSESTSTYAEVTKAVSESDQ